MHLASVLSGGPQHHPLIEETPSSPLPSLPPVRQHSGRRLSQAQWLEALVHRVPWDRCGVVQRYFASIKVVQREPRRPTAAVRSKTWHGNSRSGHAAQDGVG
jgi:hypothetical protein